MSANPYDPVTTTDTTTLADDDWGLSLPGVRYRNYHEGSRFKGICRTVQERPRLTALVCLLIAGVTLLIIIVAATSGGKAKRHPTGEEPKWEAQTEGLEFYPIPEDKSIVITFDVKDMGNHDPIQAMLDNLTAPYHMSDQLDESVYADCNSTYHPPNVTCRFARARFGADCSSSHDYGYKHAMPCIFVQMNLPDGVLIKPIDSTSPLWTFAESIMKDHKDPFSVPLTCQGKTEADRKIIGTTGLDGDAIQYFPNSGFPAYFYRDRDTSLPFMKPAMMIRLTSLRDELLVHVTCEAWGQLFNFDGTPRNHDLLRIDFAVYVRH